MKIRTLLGVFLLAFYMPAQAQKGQPSTADDSQTQTAETSAETSEEEKYWEWARELWDSLDRQTGQVTLSSAGATLEVPESFYYLNSADAEKVLVEVWGNPPGSDTLGMLFPTEMTPFDAESWAVTIDYEQDGYVSDEDAKDIDYSDLLSQMQEETDIESIERVAQGYESISLIGWAAEPYYDGETNKMYWAKEIKFGEQEVNTLNYNIRILGRKGVLVLNFIAGMDQKTLIDENLNQVLAIADFDRGSRYADFDPSVDEVAAYGLGALVAGKVMAKTGILAVILVFLKKFWFIAFIVIGAVFKKLFGRKNQAE